MIPTRLRAIALLIATLFLTGSTKRKPSVNYTVSIGPSNVSSIRVDMSFDVPGARSVRLGMATHPEYDDRFWRYVTDWHVDGFDKPASLAIDRKNVWRVLSHWGAAHVGYTIALPREDSTNRGSWHTGLRADGGSINPVDTFLYLVDYPDAEIRVTLILPTGHVIWGVPVEKFSWGNLVMAVVPPEMAPPRPTTPQPRAAQSDPLDRPTAIEARQTDIRTLLDSPILYGKNLRHWTFEVDGVPHVIAYWPLPNATPFDTTAFVDAIEKLARETVAVFGKPPYPHYQFLLEDGAYGALEHANSVTLGMPSRDLARDPRAYLAELAHEFFHAWNLVRLYPAGRGYLSERPPEHATGLWLSEGVTTYYADVLTRRAGYPEEDQSRSEWLAHQLAAYYGNPGNAIISPELASARAVDSTGINGDIEPDYYSQGRMIATALDITLRDSTRGRRGLDDLMRALYGRFAMKRGFTSEDVERTTAEVCGCDIHRFFEDYVRGSRLIDANRFLPSLGLRAIIDTVPAADSAGKPFPDLRIWVYPPKSGGRVRVMIQDPSSVWARAGLHTGDELVAFNNAPIDSFPDFRRVVRGIKLGDTVAVSMIRRGKPSLVTVRVAGYDRVRVRIDELAGASPQQLERRRLWLSASPNG